MIPASLFQTGIDWAERGLVPDPLLRVAIRRLCAERSRQETRGDCEQRLARRDAFIAGMDAGPIAPVPERANEQHYELPAAFFRYVLGPHLKYSACLWPTGDRDLAAAEAAALEQTAAHAGLADGQDILELGCGWGALTLWMAARFPASRITALSNARAQGALIEARAAERGLDNITVVTADINDFTTEQRYDRVVSVEMFEHLCNWRRLLGRIADWLRPEGRLLVHTFCHRECPYPFAKDDAGDWMARHFFTGGMMPSDGLMLQFQDRLRHRRQWRWHGGHYAATANAWLANLDRHERALRPVFEGVYGADAARWHGRWRLFFLAVAELFAQRNGDEWWVVHHLLEKPGTQ